MSGDGDELAPAGQRAADAWKENPNASLRQIAAIARCSKTTADNLRHNGYTPPPPREPALKPSDRREARKTLRNMMPTKREAFAAAAMQGFLASTDRNGTPQEIAAFSVKCADALILELSK